MFVVVFHVLPSLPSHPFPPQHIVVDAVVYLAAAGFMTVNQTLCHSNTAAQGWLLVVFPATNTVKPAVAWIVHLEVSIMLHVPH